MNHKNNLSVGATKALSLLVSVGATKALSLLVSVGATKALSLLVSVVTLVRVLFENPRDGELMLALERKVTLHEAKNGRAGDVTFESLDENLMIREFPVVFLHR